MWEWLERVFGQGFMPHGHCYLWSPSMVWTQVISNLLIGVAYASIGATLGVLVRRIKDIPFAWAYVSFGVFIVSCGLTHFFDIVTVWHPVYWADATVRIVTATASVATAVLILPLVPQATRLAETARVSSERATKLAEVHVELEEAHRRLAVREETARSRAAKSEEQFRELVDNLPDLAWTAGADGHIDFYNRRWFEYTGTTAEEMERSGWQPLHDPAILASVVARWDHSVATGEPFEMEFPLRAADGTYRWFLTRVRPLRTSNGEIARWVGVNTDIDERRKIREEIERTAERERAAREAAESSARVKDEFLLAVSHELRTPLTAILGWSRMLTTGQLSPERMAKAIETIERNAVAQVQLVEDLLDVSRIVSGKLRLEIARVDAARVIDAALDSLRPTMNARGIVAETRVEPGISVAGDAGRVQQVLWNIIGNAVKFSRPAGRITITGALRDGMVTITITDDGEGIDPAFLPFMFEPFRQEDGSSTRKHGGLGIGLTIAKEIVALHGGTLTASSAGRGQGASFVVMLPSGEGMEDTAPSERSARLGPRAVPPDTASDVRGVRVLAVDDERDAREMVHEILERYGAQVTVAASAREALALLASERFDVVVSDIGMPEKDGYAFIEEARRLPGMARVPTAALTAFARAEDRKRVLAAGFQMHVVKPVAPAELVAVVADLLKMGRSMA